MTEESVDPRIERTRQRVFEAAVDVLREEGLDAVSHSRVAEVAGVGRATLYRHWPDTTGLLLDALLERHPARFPAEVASLPFADAVHLVVRTIGRMLREDPMVPAMLGLLERAERDEDYARLRQEVAAGMSGPMDALLARAVEAGEIRADVDPQLAKAGLAGPLFFARLVLGQPFDDDRLQAHAEGWLRAVGHAG